MTKPVFGMLLGGFLGIFDGLTALISAPETRPEIVGIVIGSTIKGLVAGLLIGFLFARRLRSLPLAIVVGARHRRFLRVLRDHRCGPYLWEIVLPGTVVGIIVGYATYHYGDAARPAAALSEGTMRGRAMAACLTGGAGGVRRGAAADTAPKAKVDGKAALERLKTLAGEWRGHVVTTRRAGGRGRVRRDRGREHGDGAALPRDRRTRCSRCTTSTATTSSSPTTARWATSRGCAWSQAAGTDPVELRVRLRRRRQHRPREGQRTCTRGG